MSPTGQTAFGELAFTLNHLSVVDFVVKNGDVGKHPLYVLSFISRQVSLNPYHIATFTATSSKLSAVATTTRQLTAPSTLP